MFRPLILVLLLLAGGVMACDGVMIGDALHGNGSGTGLKTQQGEAWADGHGPAIDDGDEIVPFTGLKTKSIYAHGKVFNVDLSRNNSDGPRPYMPNACALVPDTTTHYVVRIDSTFNGYWCNSTNGYEVLRANITYDTTWAPLVTVKLRPDQVEILMIMLEPRCNFIPRRQND